MQGKIIKTISNLYTVAVDNTIYECHARGKFRNDLIQPLVGDICLIDPKNNYILEILPRKNSLERPLIANVDAALIVISVKQPELSLNLLDKMLTLIIHNKIEPIICFSKLDLLNKKAKKNIKNIKRYYQKQGFKVLINTEIRKINHTLKNKIVVITGQTGAGKSSLLNKLNNNLNLKTDEISIALGRGKHTTRHVELFTFKNYYVADTPGFSSLDFKNLTKEDIKNTFLEFQKYSCPFKNCFHFKEQDCAVKDAVENFKILESRYQNYLDFIKTKN